MNYTVIGVPSIGAWGARAPPVFKKFAGGPPQFLKTLQTGPPPLQFKKKFIFTVRSCIQYTVYTTTV